MVVVAVVALVVGTAIAGTWVGIVVTGSSPELREGRRSILFHIAAEYLAAGLLVAGGIGILVADGGAARALAGAGLGAALYSTVVSPGYYADLGRPEVVAVFLGLAALSASALGLLVHAAA